LDKIQGRSLTGNLQEALAAAIAAIPGPGSNIPQTWDVKIQVETGGITPPQVIVTLTEATEE
jgi:hypothetical protein